MFPVCDRCVFPCATAHCFLVLSCRVFHMVGLCLDKQLLGFQPVVGLPLVPHILHQLLLVLAHQYGWHYQLLESSLKLIIMVHNYYQKYPDISAEHIIIFPTMHLCMWDFRVPDHLQWVPEEGCSVQ